MPGIDTKWRRGMRLMAGYARAWFMNRLNLIGPIERITISLTDRCNSRCITCFIWRNEGTQFDLDSRALDNLARSALFLGAEEITLTGGEIFLRDDIVDIVRRLRCNRRGYLSLATNALETERIVVAVARMQGEGLRPDRAVISLDGKPETYARIRGVKDGFDRAVATARRLKAMGLDITLIFTITRHNIDEMLWASDFAGAEGFEINYYPEIEAARFEKTKPAPPFNDEQKEKILRNLAEIYRRRGHFYFDDSNWLYVQRFFSGRNVTSCEAGRQNIFVNWDGRVYPCEGLPGTEQHLGTLKEQSLDSIWKSTRAGEVRRFIRRDACQPCYIACDLIPSLRKKVPSMLWHSLKNRFAWGPKGTSVRSG
jgi:MoaA/NifB/PqqE/SkfB family radical SAM enzyme